ncbi:Extracellular ligand-binding receptor (plasmid) [Haloterrigena turkmenica DSM 5511]|uniref:Extracellular ligand-binding receptor n=1 Tax=Haloterrigena turkmenica (strain ATCC 51198 / DSM 5511 / JCM 9101 / NCIMB 13204 / VKM B-1734 / 4k) TaxID=543526 RepID=D2RZX3_HALTV|nr:Extracellular ligand-binding receptor [Haloterrigena turkmenica DSM 5511]
MLQTVMVDSGKRGSRTAGRRPDIDRRSFLTASGASALAATAGCLGGGGGSSDGITIGGLFGLPGDHPAGTGMKQTTEVLVENLNADGGLLGEEVELVTRDTEFDPATARDGYRELILDESVDVTTGIYSTEVGTAIFDEVPEFETIHLTGGSAPDRPMENYDDYKYWFRGIHGGYLGRATANYAASHFEDLGITEVGIAAEDVDGFDPVLEEFAAGLPSSVNVHFEERFSSDTSDFSPILDQGEQNDIQMMVGFVSQGGSALMSQWAQRQPNYMFGGGDVFSSNPDRWENTSGEVEYVWSYIGGAAPGLEVTETTSQLIEDHRSMFDGAAPPHAQSYTQYDAILTWAEAVKEAETTDIDEVVSTIEEMTLEGSTGTLDWYGEDGELPHTPQFGEEYVHPPVMQWQEVDGEGRQIGLYPDTVRSGELQIPPWVSL